MEITQALDFKTKTVTRDKDGSRRKKNYNPAACGTKTTFTERQDEKAEGYVSDERTR